ncbi:accessory factor UbiK family protein [Emcibacteraceae bacterium]|uniref:accessory factor UbiK family protein n=1 Tax=Pseudemcibacter sp. TaxID=2943293 RepID=UPI00230AF3BD|nr:accessory factor UbiK family protein [Kordiimonadaceae bacterium]MDA9552962.1 accessory factor UbiK family protein [Emcibacteraceae bacterium]MDA9769427.1 accessory factor UbiK family protein [Emcibacteraceae bacterium]MDG1021313.1 accessory factor UbiK family protein [Emcibacteraceae bacterium]MDG1727917.1 accessory factor UbiK family protein [Emcibacteraceae bacterium]
MQSDNKILSDLARLGQSAAGTIHGVKSEVENQVKTRLESVLMDMDLVTREEFEVVREMAVAARAENAELHETIDALKKEVNALKKKKK